MLSVSEMELWCRVFHLHSDDLKQAHREVSVEEICVEMILTNNGTPYYAIFTFVWGGGSCALNFESKNNEFGETRSE